MCFVVGKMQENHARKVVDRKIRTARNPCKIKEVGVMKRDNDSNISSQARYDHFDTLPCRLNSF